MDEDLSFFTLEELFADEVKRRKEESVSPEFRRSSSLNPLDCLVRLEEKSTLQNHARQLKRFLSRELDLGQYAFLTEIFGPFWEERLRLPLEFRHVTSDEFETYLCEHLPTIQEKIDVLIDCSKKTIRTNMMAGLQEFISIPFNLTVEDRIIEIYDQVRSGVIERYPVGFFHPHNERVPRILTRYLIQHILQFPITSSLSKVLEKKHFYENHLGWMLEQYFAGRIKHALRHTYSCEELPDLYRERYDSDDILREVFAQLEFGRRSLNGKN